MKKIIAFLAFLLGCTMVHGQTLSACQQAAEKNYPLIRRYDLIARTTALTVQNLQKEWLPQIAVTGQATYQSVVPSWPTHFEGLFRQMGLERKGLSPDQYRVSVDLQQTLYDGGAIGARSEMARLQGRVEEAQTDINLYQVRRRVLELYFALLLLNEQIQLNDDTQALLLSNEQKLSTLLKGGTVSTSDFENVKAERLTVAQQNESLRSQQQQLLHLLSFFCGFEVKSVQKPPSPADPGSHNLRPELLLYDRRQQLAEAQEHALNARLKPQLGLFAQGYYGYPGLNLFEDMMSRRWTLNGIVGLKLTWNVSALYTRRADITKLQMKRALIENDRETFLFNHRLDEVEQRENIRRYQQMMQTDRAIIALRTSIRQAAESKLSHGLIDVNGLLREINNENAAKARQAIHEIEQLKEMYNLQLSHNN